MRIVSPSKFGIAKGMLVVKDGIDKMQIPTSMIKVEKSETRPLHNTAVLIIISTFPSASCEIVERVLGISSKEATDRQRKELKIPGDSILNVLHAKGVEVDKLNQCE